MNYVGSGMKAFSGILLVPFIRWAFKLSYPKIHSFLLAYCEMYSTHITTTPLRIVAVPAEFEGICMFK